MSWKAKPEETRGVFGSVVVTDDNKLSGRLIVGEEMGFFTPSLKRKVMSYDLSVLT